MRHAVDDQVVDDPAALVRQQRVLGLAVGEAFKVVREHRLQEVPGSRPLDVELPHVRDVERSCPRAYREVLVDHPVVLDRHLPARERDEARARGDVPIVERRPTECRVHGRKTSRFAKHDSAEAESCRFRSPPTTETLKAGAGGRARSVAARACPSGKD